MGLVLPVVLAGCASAASPSGVATSGSTHNATADATAEASARATTYATATPRSTSPSANIIEGVFSGDPSLVGRCVWITDQDDVRWELTELPEGYRVDFDGAVAVLYDANEAVVARGGDHLEAVGTPDPPDIGSVCMVGRVFLVAEIHAAGSAP